MAKEDGKTVQFRACEDDFGAAFSYVEDLLKRGDISAEVASESLLVFETLFQRLIDLGLEEDTLLDISWRRRLGDLSVRVGFEGPAVILYSDEGDSIEEKILKAHDDKLDFSYRLGYNLISISVSRNSHRALFGSAIAFLLALATYAALLYVVDDQGRADLLNGYIFPLEKMYANAMLMVGAPMTFFSLLKNLTDTYIVSQRASGLRRLSTMTFVTSALAVFLGFVASLLLAGLSNEFEGVNASLGGGGLDRSFEDVVTSLVSSSIFEPFEALSPAPLIVVALLVTYALCSTGKYFDLLQRAMEACYSLFSRMLRVVIAPLPLFCYLAFLDVMLDSTIDSVFAVLGIFVAINVSLLLLFATYAIRLRFRGIAVIPFARKLGPLIRENLKIDSAIDATPFNIRYCARVYGMDRQKLERDLPVLAQTNRDGNCFIIMLIALIIAFVTGIDVSWLNIAGMGMLVLFLSYGSPNQPGSILIGALIVIAYLHTNDLICVAIYTEAILGSSLNIVNVIGDVVEVAIINNSSENQEVGGSHGA